MEGDPAVADLFHIGKNQMSNFADRTIWTGDNRGIPLNMNTLR